MKKYFPASELEIHASASDSNESIVPWRRNNVTGEQWYQRVDGIPAAPELAGDESEIDGADDDTELHLLSNAELAELIEADDQVAAEDLMSPRLKNLMLDAQAKLDEADRARSLSIDELREQLEREMKGL